jgi:hypothetical protein
MVKDQFTIQNLIFNAEEKMKQVGHNLEQERMKNCENTDFLVHLSLRVTSVQLKSKVVTLM